MPRVLPFLLVLLSLPLHAFDPFPPPGRPVGIPVREPGTSFNFEIASDGDGFFLATGDRRYGDGDVLGCRYDASGEPIDTDAFPVAVTEHDDAVHSRPIWNGAEYVVFATSEYFGTWRQRLRRDSTVHPAGLPVESRIAGSAWNGSRYAGITFSGSEVRLYLFDSELQVVNDVVIDRPEENSSWSAIATDGSQFLALWGNGPSLLAQVFDEHGSATSPRLTLATMPGATTPGAWRRGSFRPAIAWNGSAYAVAWSDGDEIDIVFFSPAGSEIARTAIPGSVEPGSIDVAWDGLTHLVTWARSPALEVQATFVSASGAIVETIPLHAISLETSVASNGRFFFVATSKERFLVSPIGSQRVSGPKPLTLAWASQYVPAITAGASTLFTAWAEDGSIFASRLDARGEPLDGRGLRLGDAGIAPTIALARAGETYLALWPQRIARVTSAGEILDREGGLDVDGKLVSSNGTSFLVAGLRNQDPAPWAAALTVTIVPARGAAQPTTILAPSVYSDSGMHALVRLRDAYALVWTNHLDPPCFSPRSCAGRRSETRVSLIADNGTLIRSVPIAAHGGAVSAASDGSTLIVAFQVPPGITTMRVTDDLTPGPETVVYNGLAASIRLTRLTRISDGFALAFNTPTSDWYEPRATLLRLDATGKPIGTPATFEKGGHFTDLVHAFGATWVTRLQSWHPIPESHDGRVWRAYVEDIRARRRVVTR